MLSVPRQHDHDSAPVRPGQFVTIAPEPGSGAVAPRGCWLVGAHRDPLHGTTWEVLWSIPDDEHQHGPPPPVGARLELLGPLGRGFRYPADPMPVLVFGDRGGQAVARWAAAELVARGCEVDLVLSAPDPDGHLDLTAARRVAGRVWISDNAPVGAALERAREGAVSGSAGAPGVVYAAGAHAVAVQVAATAASWGVLSQVTGYDPASGGCGLGLCQECSVPVIARGRQRTIQPCLDGPVLPGEVLIGTWAGASLGPG